MAQIRHLQNAPITEAIIDFRVKARSDFRPESFSSLKTSLRSDFPNIEERRGGKITFKILPQNTQPATVEDTGLNGYFLTTADKLLIAQFRADGFTLNRLNPYTSWDDIFTKALNLWKVYETIAKPEGVIRIALRYINHIQSSFSIEQYETLLPAKPVIPSELPQTVGNFFTRVSLQDQVNKQAANIIQFLELDESTKKVKLILDIDAFKIAPHIGNIEVDFKNLHDFKNKIFFSYLTEEILRTYE